jgi:hypothetical protein
VILLRRPYFSCESHKIHVVYMRFEVKITVFWGTQLCSFVNKYQHSASIFYPENGGSRFLHNIDTYHPSDTT